MTAIKKTIQNHIDEFKKALEAGINGIVEASQIYVKAIDEDPYCATDFQEAFADCVPNSAWANFEAVGRKWMHPKLLMGGIANRKKNAIIKNLPYSTQERIFEKERFDLLTVDGDKLQIDLLEATVPQMEQVCGDGSVRTMSEQRAWIEQQKKNEKIEAETLPYVINANSVTFKRGTRLTRGELKRILQEM